MQEDIKKIKRDKVLKLFVTFALVIVFCASLVLAICAPIFNSTGVAYADSSYGSVGTVNSNLFTNPKFDKQGPSAFVFQNKFAQDIVYPEGTTLSYVSSHGGFMVSTTTTAGANHWMAFLFKPSTVGTYTFTINSDIVGSTGYKFRLRDTSYKTYVDSDSANFTNYISITYNITDLSKNYILQFVMPNANVSASIYWLKIEKGSTFTGYVPNYQDTIASLQNQVEKLQGQYNKLLDSMDFSTFNSVDLNSTKPLIASTTMGNSIGSSTAIVTYKDVTYGGYWYYRNSVEKDPYSLGLAELDIGSTLLAGSDIKISYDALFPYNGTFPDNVGVVLTFSNFGVYSSASNLKVASVFIPASDFTSKEFIYNFDFDVNYITFGVGTFDSSSNTFNDITLGYDINSSVKQGVFISNFVVKGRGSNFNVAIDNARKDGYNKGYQEGKVAGREVGYQEGVKDQGDYTFMGLLGAVFDAPIQAFKGLLSFEVLGVNMTAFVSSLFGLAVILLIIKLILGGK